MPGKMRRLRLELDHEKSHDTYPKERALLMQRCAGSLYTCAAGKVLLFTKVAA